MISKPSGRSSSCTVTYVNGTASVSCVDSTSCGYQVILLQDNDPYNWTVVNVRPGDLEKPTVSVVPNNRYCIMELPIGDGFDSEVKYSKEFVAEEASMLNIVLLAVGIGKLADSMDIILLCLLAYNNDTIYVRRKKRP